MKLVEVKVKDRLHLSQLRNSVEFRYASARQIFLLLGCEPRPTIYVQRDEPFMELRGLNRHID